MSLANTGMANIEEAVAVQTLPSVSQEYLFLVLRCNEPTVPPMRISLTGALLHRWPGNIRELEQKMTAAAVPIKDRFDLATLDRLLTDVDPISDSGPGLSAAPSAAPRGSPEHLASLLRRHGGNISRVAQALGTSRSQVYRLLKRYDLLPPGANKEGASSLVQSQV